MPIAIASGAQRHEIEEVLDATRLRGHFAVIVAAGDTPEGKPSPAPYALAFHLLQKAAARWPRTVAWRSRTRAGGSTRRAAPDSGALGSPTAILSQSCPVPN